MNFWKLLRNTTKSNKEKIFLIIDNKKYSYERFFLDVELKRSIIEFTRKRVIIKSENWYDELVSFFAVCGSDNIPIILHSYLDKEEISNIIENNNIDIIINNNQIIHLNTPYYNSYDLDEEFGVLSSGTTGTPKIIYRSYESWGGFFQIQNKIFKIDNKSVLFMNGDISFSGNLNVLLGVLFAEGTVIIDTTMKVKNWKGIIENNCITNIYLIPTKLKMFISCCSGELDKVITIFSGSQFLDNIDIDSLKKIFINADIILYYGASELSYVTYINYRDNIWNQGKVGNTFPNVRVSIIEEHIYVESPYLAKGIQSPATVKDLGYLDQVGCLYLQGRGDRLVNIAGIKVDLNLIENSIKKVSEIRDLVVVPYKDKLRGMAIVIFIVINKDVNKEYILNFIRMKLLKGNIKTKIIFLDTILRNEIGKVDKNRLDKMLSTNGLQKC